MSVTTPPTTLQCSLPKTLCFVRLGAKTIGLPPRLEQPDVVNLIYKLNSCPKTGACFLDEKETALLTWLFDQPDLWNQF